MDRPSSRGTYHLLPLKEAVGDELAGAKSGSRSVSLDEKGGQERMMLVGSSVLLDDREEEV